MTTRAFLGEIPGHRGAHHGEEPPPHIREKTRAVPDTFSPSLPSATGCRRGGRRESEAPIARRSLRSSVPTRHTMGIERPRCVDRLPSHISKTMVPYAVVDQKPRRGKAAVRGKSAWSSGPPWSPEYRDSWVSSWYKYQRWVLAPSVIS